MKLRYVVLLLSIVVSLQAKELEVLKTRNLSGSMSDPVFFPSYSIDGSSIYFTHEGYRGLWKMDRSSLEITLISEEQGAGFSPISLPSGSLVFRQDDFINGRKYTSLNLFDDHNIHRLSDKMRFLSTGIAFDDRILFQSGAEIIMINTISEAREQPDDQTIALINANRSLILQNGRIQNTLEPLGSGNYIWGKLSPQKDLIVFTKIGRGTYVCDISGQIVLELGYANAPEWSPDGHFIAYMKDLDDGEQFTASEIWVSSVTGSQSWMITNTPDRIEMYPQWSPDGQQIIYHSTQGEIFETTLKIEN